MAVYNDVSLAEKIRIYDRGVEPPVTDNFGEFQLAYRHGAITIPYIPWREPLRLECEHFVECVRTGTIPRTDGVQGLAVVAVLEAANESLANAGMRVPVSIPSQLESEAIWLSPNGQGQASSEETMAAEGADGDMARVPSSLEMGPA
jgi:hypothetical protein